MDLAERHRQHISRWFYECGYDVHRGLAEMYVADARFAETVRRKLILEIAGRARQEPPGALAGSPGG